MRIRVRIVLAVLVAALAGAVTAGAQVAPPTQAVPPAQPQPPAKTEPAAQGTLSLPFLDSSKQWRYERVGEHHWKLTGDVELESGDTKFYADQVEIFTDQDKMVASGNVVMATSTQRIGADSMEFNIRTKLGTFHSATGSARMAELPTRNILGSQEPDILFYGKTIEKIAERKYKITDGAFTTCVQPSPRWQISSGTVVLNLDSYAYLINPVLKVKSVPILYLPAIYYPINKEDRATGFLMPFYTTSSLRGHQISSAFFWAIGRSQDATFMHDWYSKTGMGYGSEYRYRASGSSAGNFSFYRLNEHETVYENSDGSETVYPARESFQIRSGVSQALPLKLKGSARIDYFSNIAAQQQYNTNIYQASQVSRAYGGGVAGSYGSYTVSGSMDRNEYFYSSQDSVVSGAWPRLYFARAERPIGNLPLYTSVNVDWSNQVRESVYRRTDRTVTIDSGVQKFDVLPTLRFPFTKLQWLPVNAAISWRYTHWNESLQNGQQVEVPVTRTFFDMSVRASGPILNRIWNTNNGFAEKIKHTVEPWVFFNKFTSFDTFDQIIAYDSSDYLVPGVTRITYGLNNRLYARRTDEKGNAQTHQFVNVAIRQTYYTDQRASTVDPNYSSSYYTGARSNWSPVSLAANFSPRQGFDAVFRTEYNVDTYQWQTFGAAGTYNYKEILTTAGGWSRRTYAIYSPGSANSNHYMDASVMAKTPSGRIGGAFSFNYDIQNRFFLQQRYSGFYNAQCCGVAAEFQTYNFSGFQYVGYRPPVDKDVRFSVSVTLAGLGTFSNFLGIFGLGQGYQ